MYPSPNELMIACIITSDSSACSRRKPPPRVKSHWQAWYRCSWMPDTILVAATRIRPTRLELPDVPVELRL